MAELWQSFGNNIVNILPRSPFAAWIDNAQSLPYMNYVNWVIPFGDMLQIFGVWLSAVAVFYLAQIVLRWVKVIQG